ncbi:MAG: hypothetical protein WC703_07810, partial [Candidatus Neomarinimicrobiota bacterium]
MPFYPEPKRIFHSVRARRPDAPSRKNHVGKNTGLTITLPQMKLRCKGVDKMKRVTRISFFLLTVVIA